MFKRLFLPIILGVMFFSSTSYAQKYVDEDVVPILIRNSFYDNYSGTYDIDKDIRWINDNTSVYTAEYSKNNTTTWITYDENGSIMRTESQIEMNSLPYPIREHFISVYPNVKMDYSGIIDDAESGIIYRVGYSEASPGSPRSYIYYKEDGTKIDWK